MMNPIIGNYRDRPRVSLWLVWLAAMCLMAPSAMSMDHDGLLQVVPSPVLDPAQRHFAEVLIHDEYTAAYWYVKVDASMLRRPAVWIALPDGGVEVLMYDYRRGFGKTESWFGKYEGGMGDAIFTLHEDMVTARLGGMAGSYMIYPITGGLHMLVRLNTHAFPNDESAEGYRHMNSREARDERSDGPAFVDPELIGQSARAAGDCKVRILVAYTDDIAAAVADPLGLCQSAINAVNTAFSNSEVNFEVELACALETDYAESGNSTTDKTRFRSTNDGYMDEIHDWRTYYDADLCHLLVENLSNACGEAWSVSVSSYANGFCVTDRGCAIGNNTFAHELAHLYGCRHDPYVDGSTSPYAYAHGYVYLAGSWRTIMAYNNLCSANGTNCTRISYFSNPAVNYSGNSTGVSGISDNESCHEASRSAIAALETTTTNKSFPAWTHENDEYADVIATTSVTNSAAYVMNSGSEVTWRANDYHVLGVGFWAKSGSAFQTLFDNCSVIAPRETGAAESADKPGPPSLLALPNPFREELEIIVYLQSGGPVTVELYSLFGERVSGIYDGTLPQAGSYKFSVNGAGLAAGMYTCVVRTDAGIRSARIVRLE